MPIVEAMMVIQEMQRAGYGDSRMADVFGPPEFESWASSAAILHGWPMDLCRKAWIAARDKERERCAMLCEGMEPLAGPAVHDIARAIRKGSHE